MLEGPLTLYTLVVPFPNNLFIGGQQFSKALKQAMDVVFEPQCLPEQYLYEFCLLMERLDA